MSAPQQPAATPWPPARQRVSPGRTARAVWRALRLLGLFARGRLELVRFPELTPAQRDATLMRWSRDVLSLLDLNMVVSGQPAPGPVLVVSNHLSWLDIMAINAHSPARFVAKSEIRSWPLIGTLCALSGTLFISRGKRSDARRMVSDLAQRLQQGEVMGFFPEGTTGEGHTVLHFYANLFQAAAITATPVQPLAVRYTDAQGRYCPETYFGGDVTFAASLWWILCAEHITCQLQFLPPMDSAGRDRHQLARQAHEQICASLPALPDAAPLSAETGP